MINNFHCSQNQNTSNFSDAIYYLTKGSRFSIAAFLLLITAFLSSACESPGPVGDDIISGEEPVKSQTFYIEDYSVLEENFFSGQLINTAAGYFEDPLYGTMRSVALLKPSISTTNVDTILENDTISLRIVFNESIYGDSLAASDYEIFEAGEIWRGTELYYNREVPVNMASKVAEFQIPAQEDTVVVDLNETWTSKFAEYFNSDTTLTPAERDSVYINNFPGLAIVPSDGNRNIRFLKMVTTREETEEGEEEIATSFLLESANQDNDDDDEEEEEPEVIIARDWGTSFTRGIQNEPTDGFVLHNTERILKIRLNLPVEDLSSKNIVNAQLVLSKDSRASQDSPDIARPNTNLIRAHVFDSEPRNVMAEIFTSDHTFATALDDTSNTFKMNITQLVLNEVFGDVQNRVIYVTAQSVNGIYYSSSFFDSSATEIRKPRLVITYVE